MPSASYKANLSSNLAICAPAPRSSLLDLPYELHQEIYNHILTPWSLAIFNLDDHHDFDKTIQLRRVGNLVLSGPPGYPLLVSCRHMHNLLKHRFGSKYTGIVYVGIMQRLAVVAARLPRGFRRWYKKTSVMYSVCPQYQWDITTYFTRVFRNVRIFDSIMFVGLPGPHHNLHQSYLGFIDGRDDGIYTDLTTNASQRFFSRHPKFKWLNLAQDISSVADVVLNFKVLAPRNHRKGDAALVVRCEGLKSTVVARMTRLKREIVYWEEGMYPGTYQRIKIRRDEDYPEKMQWFKEVCRYHDYPSTVKTLCANHLGAMLVK